MGESDFSFGALLGSVKDITQSVLNYRLSKEIDTERNKPFYATDPAGAQWYVGPDGQLYPRGNTVVPATTASLLSSPVVVVSLLAGAGLVLFLALKD